MQKEKAMLYMYDAEMASLVRHQSLLKRYEIIKLVSPIGWGFEGKDASVVDNGGEMGIVVESDFLNSLEVCDTVIVGDCRLYKNLQEDLYQAILRAVEKGKNIICLREVDKDFKEKLLQKKLKNNYLVWLEDLQLYNTHSAVKKVNSSLLEWEIFSGIEEEIYTIETPVVFVMGVTEQTEKFEIQLILREGMQQFGYQVSQIGTKKYCKLLDFASIPQFMYEKKFSEAEKIVMFNRYIKTIERAETPDLIVIGIPGGIMKVSEKYTNGFGILAYEISQAVVPDYVVMSTFYDNYSPEYFHILQSISKYRFGFEVDSFVIANTQMDWEEVLKGNSDFHVKLKNEYINQKIKDYTKKDLKVFNIFCKEDGKALVKDVIIKLNSYSEVAVL